MKNIDLNEVKVLMKICSCEVPSLLEVVDNLEVFSREFTEHGSYTNFLDPEKVDWNRKDILQYGTELFGESADVEVGLGFIMLADAKTILSLEMFCQGSSIFPQHVPQIEKLEY